MFWKLKELTKTSFRKYFIKFVKMKGKPQSPNVFDMNYKYFKDFVFWTKRSSYP